MDAASMKFSPCLQENVRQMQEIFKNDSTFIYRSVQNAAGTLSCAVFFLDGMVNSEMMGETILRPITLWTGTDPVTSEILAYRIMQANDSKIVTKPEDMFNALLYGDTVVFVDGHPCPTVVNTKGFSFRSSSEPDNEKVIQGSREGFTEAFMVNLSMIRRRLTMADLKFTFLKLGTRSNTTVSICYIDSLCDKKVLSELERRLNSFDLDSVLDSNYIAECIKDTPWSPFPTIGVTERPDVVAAKLLEGRVALVVDGTPAVLTVPHVFQESFQSNDDYYADFQYTNIGRILRLIGFFLTISIPAVYVALLTYHQEMIPTKLLFSVASSRGGVPFPTLLETLILLLIFEILKEAGTRTPGNFGQTLSIVGALVLGQAAVEARFVSAPVVIIVAFSGITALMVPKLKTATSLLRVFLLLLSAVIGLYGYILGISLILIHLCSLESFSVPFLINFLSVNTQSREDVFVRYPWFRMKKTHRFLASQHQKEDSQ